MTHIIFPTSHRFWHCFVVVVGAFLITDDSLKIPNCVEFLKFQDIESFGMVRIEKLKFSYKNAAFSMSSDYAGSSATVAVRNGKPSPFRRLRW